MKVYKINELFDASTTYNYEQESEAYKNKNGELIYTYTFVSKDNIKYYVGLRKWNYFLTMEFADEENYTKFSKHKFILMNKNDSIKVLNTVIKIAKDFMDEHPDINVFGINSDEKRFLTYKYIFQKYFKNWRMIIKKKDSGRYDMSCIKPNENTGEITVDWSYA